LAERFERDEQAIRRWARKGVLPSIRPDGKEYAFTEEHVQAFLAGLVTPPVPVEPKPTRNPRKYTTSK
jgi:predicted site-specific integrase-resolvase